MIWIDVEQNTDEWMALRCGKIGGSSIGAIMANYGKAFGPPAHNLALQVAIEQITGEKQESSFSNDHLQRGHEQEPIARALYEKNYFVDVQNGGFYDSFWLIGVSPDGLVDDDGLIEIKSVIQSVHFANIQRGKFDPSYKWQLYLELKCGNECHGRTWIDFISFCQTFPENKRLFVDRVHIDDIGKEIDMIETRLNEFEILVEEKTAVIMDRMPRLPNPLTDAKI